MCESVCMSEQRTCMSVCMSECEVVCVSVHE